jgi:hypothetical protein
MYFAPLGQAGDQRAQVGQRGVVGDRGQAQRAEEQGGRLQARHDGLQPPLLHPPSTTRPARKKPTSRPSFRISGDLVARIGLGEAEEQQEQAEEQHRMVGQQHDAARKAGGSAHQRRHRARAPSIGCRTGAGGAQQEGDDGGVDQHRERARQPKCVSMKALSQPQAPATISTGGAAYEVRVPPIETLTNSTPSAKVLQPFRHALAEHGGASISAARVIAAGSVISEPASGTSARPSQACATSAQRRKPRQQAQQARTASSTGREAATTITTNTNSGSVYWRDSA